MRLAQLGRLPPTLQGAFWIIVSGFAFTAMTGLIRPLSEELNAFQIVFLRNALGLLVLAPWLTRGVELRVWRSPNRHLHLIRALLFFCSMACWFTAIPLLPIVDAVALNFTAPMLITGLAAVALGEKLRARRLSAIAVGFCGVLVVLRPGFEQIGLGQILVLGDAAFWAVAVVLVRTVARAESARTIVCYMFVLVLPLSAIPAAFVWVWPSPAGWGLIMGLAISSTIGHLCATQALVCAEASAVMPYDYLRLVWFGLLGWLAFGEVPDSWSLLGALLIAGAAVYILRREAQIAKQARDASSSQ